MSQSPPLELLTDAAGSATFGWAGQGVYYARFSRELSARLGEAFAGHLRRAAKARPLKYFADASALETYDLLARRALVRVVTENRRRFLQIVVLSWPGAELSPALTAAIGEPFYVTRDPVDFETRLLAAAPRARAKLARPEPRHRSRWALRR